MSKIGKLNLELQEQANELGFSTVQEALNNGYKDVYNPETGAARLVPDIDQAHKDYLREKEVLLGDLNNLLIHRVFDHDIIEHAINFIKQGEL